MVRSFTFKEKVIENILEYAIRKITKGKDFKSPVDEVKFEIEVEKSENTEVPHVTVRVVCTINGHGILSSSLLIEEKKDEVEFYIYKDTLEEIKEAFKSIEAKEDDPYLLIKKIDDLEELGFLITLTFERKGDISHEHSTL